MKPATIRAVLLNTAAAAQAKGMKVDKDTAIVDAVDGDGRPFMFLGVRIVADMIKRGVVFGVNPDNSRFFLDDGKRQRFAVTTELLAAPRAPRPRRGATPRLRRRRQRRRAPQPSTAPRAGGRVEP